MARKCSQCSYTLTYDRGRLRYKLVKLRFVVASSKGDSQKADLKTVA